MSNSKNSKLPFERKNKKDGTPNPKYVDILEVDKPIAGQNFACLSFISPEKILKQREMFYFEQFLKEWEFTKSMEKFAQFLNFMSFKYKLSFEEITKDYDEFVKEERDAIVSSCIEDDYKTFLDRKQEVLDKQFNTKHNFQTNTRAVKLRGVFATQEEAELRCKMLREIDPNFDIFVGPVGMWLPWDPDAFKTGRVEYMEEELNQLAHEKSKNDTMAKTAFEQRVRETKEKAIKDNITAATKSGNQLTQTIDEEGNLISIGGSTQEKALTTGDESISVADIRNELFEGDNIVVGKTDNGRSELVSGPFAIQK